jgi:hypothetical protein
MRSDIQNYDPRYYDEIKDTVDNCRCFIFAESNLLIANIIGRVTNFEILPKRSSIEWHYLQTPGGLMFRSIKLNKVFLLIRDGRFKGFSPLP